MLGVRDLAVRFERYRGLLGRERTTVLDRVDVDVRRGEVVAVVGASGAGKSLLAHAILGVLPGNAQVGGSITFEGAPLDPARQRALRGRAIALVPQAITYLDPTARAGRQVALSARRSGTAADPRGAAVAELAHYGLAPAVARLYPHELSGGMARRVMSALATVSGARLLVADEPTNGLDPAVTATALEHLRARADAGAGVLLITHDVASVAPVADTIAVLHAGRTVEVAAMGAFVAGPPAHPYAATLKAALPGHGFAAATLSRPSPARAGCLFAADCARATPVCRAHMPGWTDTATGRVRCHHAAGS